MVAEFMLAIGLLLLVALIASNEAKRYGESAHELGEILGWMRCQETTNKLTQEQIDILTRYAGLKPADAQNSPLPTERGDE